MSLKPEENLLDAELRKVFHNYDLSPTEYPNVWAGVEARIATLPVPRTGLSAQLLLPLTAAVLGVAVGWLLPHPATLPKMIPATSTAPRKVRVTSTAPLLSQATEATAPTSPALALSHVSPPVKAQKQLVLTPTTKLKMAQRANPPAPAKETASSLTTQSTTITDLLETVSTTTVAATAHVAPLTAVADSFPAVALNPPEPTESPLVSALPITAHPAKELKPKGTNEKIVYHKPTNRQPEQGRNIHRWLLHLTQTLRHVVNL